MRLRTMELPTYVDGDKVITPWVWVVDDLGEWVTQQDCDQLREKLRGRGGAVDALVFSREIDLE